MFKNAIILLLVLVLASSVFSARLIDPISKELSPTDNFVGTVAIGNTMELIFSKELSNPYESVEVVTPLPSGFATQIKYEMESIKLFVSVPKDAPLGDYPFTVRLSGSSRDDKFGLFLTVVAGALDVSPSSVAENSALIGTPAEYSLFFVNNTDSSAVFTVDNSLPPNWNQQDLFATKQVGKQVVVPKRQSLEEKVIVYPRLQGKKEFVSKISFENTSKDFSFVVNGLPTINSKMSAVSLGLPFYSFSMLPSYFVNGLAAFFFK